MDKDNKHLFENYLNLNEEKKKNRPVPPPLPGKKPVPPVIPGEEKRRKEEERRRKWRERGKKINTGIEKAVDYVTDKDNLKAAGQGAVNVARGAGNVARGAGKAANYLLNPFNQKGALSDAARKMKSFRAYVAGENPTDPGITDLDSVKGFRDKYVYPRENDVNLNQKVLDILTIPHVPFPLQTISGDGAGPHGSDSKKVLPQIASAFGEYVFKRNRPLRSAAHIANLILDVYVLNLRKEIPPKNAMKIALDEVVKSGTLRRWFRDESGLLPADVTRLVAAEV